VKDEHADYDHIDARDDAGEWTNNGDTTSLESALKNEQSDY
jgi:hypothetical protein